MISSTLRGIQHCFLQVLCIMVNFRLSHFNLTPILESWFIFGKFSIKTSTKRRLSVREFSVINNRKRTSSVLKISLISRWTCHWAELVFCFELKCFRSRVVGSDTDYWKMALPCGHFENRRRNWCHATAQGTEMARYDWKIHTEPVLRWDVISFHVISCQKRSGPIDLQNIAATQIQPFPPSTNRTRFTCSVT